MSTKSKIEWTDTTWNWVTGCDKVSAGCDNCYACSLAKKLKAWGNRRYQNDGPGGPGFGVTVHDDLLVVPLRWRKPRVVFVNSMSDLFHKDVPEDKIQQCFQVMARTPQHHYQLLTKRPPRMRKVVSSIYGSLPPLENVWLGTSIEDDSTVFRADWLRKTPAAVRFLSLEPLIGSVDSLDLSGIDWVIVGGESGKGHRPMDPDWVRSIRDRCVALGIPLFFKQWGHLSNNPDPTDPWAKKNGGSSKGGALLDGTLWHQFPGRVQAAITPSQPKKKSRKRRKGSSAPTVARSSSAVNQRRSKTAA